MYRGIKKTPYHIKTMSSSYFIRELPGIKMNLIFGHAEGFKSGAPIWEFVVSL